MVELPDPTLVVEVSDLPLGVDPYSRPARLLVPAAAADNSPRNTDNTTRSFSSGFFFEAFAIAHLLTKGSNPNLCKKE